MDELQAQRGKVKKIYVFGISQEQRFGDLKVMMETPTTSF